MSDALFDKIKAYLDARDKSTPSKIPHVFKFVLTKDGAAYKTFVLDLVHFTISKEDGPADVTATLDAELAKKIFTQQVDAAEALGSGQATVEGDLELLLKLKPFLSKLNQ